MQAIQAPAAVPSLPLPGGGAADPFAEPAGAEAPLRDSALPTCPACTGLVQFSSAAGLVRCPACGWQIHLAPDDSFELTKALAGISDTPARLLLYMLVQARSSASLQAHHLSTPIPTVPPRGEAQRARSHL